MMHMHILVHIDLIRRALRPPIRFVPICNAGAAQTMQFNLMPKTRRLATGLCDTS